MMQDNLLDSMSRDEYVKNILDEVKPRPLKDCEVVRQEDGSLALVLMSGNNTSDLMQGGCHYRLDRELAAELAKKLNPLDFVLRDMDVILLDGEHVSSVALIIENMAGGKDVFKTDYASLKNMIQGLLETLELLRSTKE